MGKPNLIVVLIDQLRAFSLGCYGDKFIKTPHIDNLAKNGVRFETCVTNCPVCVPARSVLLTGQHARTCVGTRLNEMTRLDNTIDSGEQLGRNDRLKHPDPSIPDQFKKMGYKTALIGKWHVDTRPSKMGFDESVLPSKIFTKGTFIENEGKEFKVDGFTSDYEIHRVKEYIKQNKDNPFFLYYNIIHPHMPILDVPYKYSHMYDPKQVPLRKNVWKNKKLPYSELWCYIYMWQEFYRQGVQPVVGKPPKGFGLRELTALYYGAISIVDDLVGELVKTLRETGIDKNTVIVFTSDHGEMMGSHHLWNKDRMFEEAVRVPLIVVWPDKIKKPVVNKTQMVSLVDLMPTILGLVGGDIPDSVQGKNVAPVIMGEVAFIDNPAFIDTPYAEIAIRTMTHKYGMLITKDNKIKNEKYVFYDLVKDPYEMHNLVNTNKQKDVADKLKKQLLDWNKNTPVLSTGAPFTNCVELPEELVKLA